MVNELWPTRRKAKESPLHDLMVRIETMVREGQAAELRILVRDLGELTAAVRELITQMEAQKLDRTKGGIEEVVAHLRGKVERKRPPQGREAVRGMAAWIARS